jgi:hypothetical protein
VVGLLTHAAYLEHVDLAIRDFLDPELAAWLSEQKSIVYPLPDGRGSGST